MISAPRSDPRTRERAGLGFYPCLTELMEGGMVRRGPEGAEGVGGRARAGSSSLVLGARARRLPTARVGGWEEEATRKVWLRRVGLLREATNRQNQG